MVFKGVIDSVTCAYAYLSVGLKAYLCEQLPACACVRTVSRFLNSQNYYYLQTRRKGLMTAEDHSKRVKFQGPRSGFSSGGANANAQA